MLNLLQKYSGYQNLLKTINSLILKYGCRSVSGCMYANMYIYFLLQALIVQLRPKECLVVANDSNSDARKLVQVIERSGVLVSERKRS